MSPADRHNNELTAELLVFACQRLPDAGSFAAEIDVLESVVAGLIAYACVRYDKRAEAALEVFCAGLRSRFDQVIYGRQQ